MCVRISKNITKIFFHHHCVCMPYKLASIFALIYICWVIICIQKKITIILVKNVSYQSTVQ